jgi:glycosyltransferase involved in cell wall biosynthesis
MKHVLWVNGWPGIGGAERAQLALVRELAKRHRVSAVLSDKVTPALEESTRALGISCTRAPLTQLRQTLEPVTLARFASRWARSNKIVYDIVRRERVDLVHVTHLYDIPFCTLGCAASRVPLFWWVEDPDRYDAVNRFITNASRVDAYAGTSNAILEHLAQNDIRAPLETLVPNPFDETVFFPSDDSAARARAGLPVRVGFAGLFIDRKGVLELCRAFIELTRRVPDARLELWLAGGGGGAYRAAMEDALRRGSVWERVRIVEGLKTPAEMLTFYRDIDVFVMLTKGEGLSIAMLESMACGLPAAILSPWGDDVILHGTTGIVLPSDEPIAVARALLPLVTDAALRLQMGRRAAEHLRQNFSSVIVAERMAAFYEKIWTRHANGRGAS